MFRSIRARLTIWYVTVLGIVLIAFSLAGYWLLARSLYDRLDTRVAATLQTVATALKGPLLEHSTNIPVAQVLQELRPSNDRSIPETVAVLDANGRVIAQKTAPGGIPLRVPSPLAASESIQFYELPESQTDADDSCRGAFQRVVSPTTGDAYAIVALESLEPLEDQLEFLQDVLYIAVPFCLLLTGLGGWFLARKSLAPVLAMSQQAQQISASNLDQRLPVVNPHDELGRLAGTFNELLVRLNQSFVQQRQFMADASHELRTPLSAIRTTSAVTLQRDRETGEYREALSIIEQEARRLTRIVEDMFLLARADAGHRTLQNTHFYLDELLGEAQRAATILASQKGLELQTSQFPEAPFFGDETLMRQMMWNLLDNAIKHTPQGGRVAITLESRDTEYVITVADTGSGIPYDLQANIFERFYRVDQARTREETRSEGGAGLGLSIARWIAEVHHGRLELRHSGPTGSTFVVTLPRT